ncbi:DUF3987 domain-containing protein [Marinobacter vinifirmus]|uniref:DUF3987 domain-containing protein n=1 Tax=Marinobacter vinifirmus TaxID=355591 RepID=A0A558B8K7_9GAMM|nr:DUF3987 domain-containing protein [Marinobacter vinifirmus]TVT32828.1 MAG: DUF3987 domain-containing protein [Marinobacter vinifirmus]
MSSNTLRQPHGEGLDIFRERTEAELHDLHQQHSAEYWDAVVADMVEIVATLLAKYDHEQQAAQDRQIMEEFEASCRPLYRLENPPPGFAGVLANAILQGSYQPASEIAIAAMLGLLAGTCGRAFCIPTGKDCALYIIVVAKSGLGKEATHEGIHAMIGLSGIPEARYFVQAVDFASGPALQKRILDCPGFLNLQGEFGRKLRRMSNAKDAPMQELRSVMTKAHNKDWLDGMEYSNAEKNKLGVKWPALSFLGETTPGTFTESLGHDMMEDGFLSRFNIIIYDGEWKTPNRNRQPYHLSPDELAHWQRIIRRVLPYQGTLHTPEARIQVEYGSDTTQERLESFENECGKKGDSIEDEFERQAYTRAAVKAYKIASLLAIADNPERPMIFNNHAKWAIDMIRRDIAAFVERKESGDVGKTDDARTLKVKKVMTDFLRGKVPPSYKVDPRMVDNGVLPRAYIQKRIGKGNQAFNSHPQGHVVAIDATIKNLIDNGNLMEVPKVAAVESYDFHGRCFRILSVD